MCCRVCCFVHFVPWRIGGMHICNSRHRESRRCCRRRPQYRVKLIVARCEPKRTNTYTHLCLCCFFGSLNRTHASVGHDAVLLFCLVEPARTTPDDMRVFIYTHLILRRRAHIVTTGMALVLCVDTREAWYYRSKQAVVGKKQTVRTNAIIRFFSSFSCACCCGCFTKRRLLTRIYQL